MLQRTSSRVACVAALALLALPTWALPRDEVGEPIPITDPEVVERSMSAAQPGDQEDVGALWLPYEFVTIDYPGAVETAAHAINMFGQVVGTYSEGDGLYHGFLYHNGSFEPFDFPGAVRTFPVSINELGHVVGWYRLPDEPGIDHGFVWQDGDFTTLDFPGSSYTLLSHITNWGHITGIYGIDGGPERGFVLRDGDFTTIDFPGAFYTVVGGSDGLGRIVGSYGADHNESRGFLYVGGEFTTIDFPGAIHTRVNNRNILGLTVGNYSEESGFCEAEGIVFVCHGFLLKNGHFRTLDAPGAESTVISGVDLLGRVAGWYADPDDTIHGFVAAPSLLPLLTSDW